MFSKKPKQNTAPSIHLFKDEYLFETERLLSEFPDVFSEEDKKFWRQDLLRFLLKETPHVFIYILVCEDIVVGATMVHEDDKSENHYWEVDWMVIKSEEQGKGFGKLLLSHALEIIQEKKGQRVYLRTSAARFNEKAQHFYEHMGFKKLAIFPHYYSSYRHAHDENAILFLREL